MAYSLAPFIKQRFFDTNGDPLAGGLLYAYQAATTTPQATYTDSTGGTPNANPVVLDANGEANVWTDVSLSYKFVLKNSSGVTQWTVDNVIGLITNNAVSTAALQDDSVTQAKIADDAVGSDQLADHASIDASRAVSTNHIKDAVVTNDKLHASATSSGDVKNLGLAASVASNALTVALKSKALTDPSATDYVSAAFRNATSATGDYVVRKATAAASIVISSGSTLGHVSAINEPIFVYLLDNAGTMELALSSSIYDNGSIVTTTVLAGGGGDDSRTVIYSTAARSNVAIRLVGRLESNQATAGTWATAIAEISLTPFDNAPTSSVFLSVGNGHGSTNTMIRRYTTSETIGTDLTYADSSTLGGSITVNKSGMYSLSASDVRSSANATLGLSLNTSAPTTSIFTLTRAQGFITATTCTTNLNSSVSVSRYFSKGDVIRIHTDGAMTGNSLMLSNATITRVS